jgi:hypothetical protein
MTGHYQHLRLLAVLTLLAASGALAQEAFLERWHALHNAQPKAVELVISVPKTAFYLGEVIPLNLAFTSTQPKAFLADTRLHDRAGRMNYMEEFIVDRAELTEDPLQGLPGGQGGMGGLSGGPAILSEKPLSLERILNEWVRFREPGRYRIYILSRRISLANGPGPQRGKPVEVVSNVLALELRPAPAEWVKQQITVATKILDAPLTTGDSANERIHAGQILRFLDTPASAAELVKRLGGAQDVSSYSLHVGVLASSHRKLILPLAEERLVAAEQPVWDRYLDTLAHLAELVASGGPMAPYPKEEKRREAWQAESKRRVDLRARKRDEYIARLIAALPAKRPDARAVSSHTLVDAALQTRTRPAWFSEIVKSLVADFRSLPAMTQRDLLEHRWNTIKSPAMLPILWETYASPPAPRVDPPLEDLALRRLGELAPDMARGIVLDQLRRPTKPLRWPTLAMLPDASLPELDEVLAGRFERGEWVDNLILRYATGAIVERVKAAYERRREEMSRQKLPQCLSPLVFYFLRHDPGYGERELRRIFAEPPAAPVCHDLGAQFRELDRYAMSPALERLAIEYLASPSVLIKDGAAELLRRFGSPAAKRPLWDTTACFRNWWKGREQELKEPQGAEGIRFERTLRLALAQADAWVLQEAELLRLLSLCSSDWCKQDVGGWLQLAKAPAQIAVAPELDGYTWTLAQYTVASEEQLRSKLLQYPRGTAFRIAGAASENQAPWARAARESIERAVRAAGHVIAP